MLRFRSNPRISYKSFIKHFTDGTDEYKKSSEEELLAHAAESEREKTREYVTKRQITKLEGHIWRKKSM